MKKLDKSWQNINAKSIESTVRKIYVANFRKLTAHDLLYKHLARIGVKLSPLCPLCQNYEQTSDHILNCENLKNFRENLQDMNDEAFFSEIYWYVRDHK